MMEETLEFTAVCPFPELAEGEMRAVHIGERRILLALVEGTPYALGAVCTHERAHLDEGTLMGHEVYCPLHFSCFDVRTGEALAPPADRATPVYAVKVENDTVYVSVAPVDPESIASAPADVEDRAGASGAVGVATPVAVPGTDTGARSPEAPPVGSEAPTLIPAPRQPGALPARLLDRAEELPVLVSGAEALGAALRPLREGRRGGRIFDLLHGRALGHAVHPALSDLPIGLWAGALLLDVVGRVDAGTILAGAGAVAGFATVATGVADWTVSDGRDRRLGLLHGVTQTLALVIVCASVGVRLGHIALLGQILLAVGLVMSLSSAYLGGHLVFGRGVMVDHTAWIRGPRDWTRAIAATELAEGRIHPVVIDDRRILISVIDGGVSAMEGACTHAGGPLWLGDVTDGTVRCPWHGSCFRLRDGAVVRGPAGHPQPMLDVRIRDGWVEVRGQRH